MAERKVDSKIRKYAVFTLLCSSLPVLSLVLGCTPEPFPTILPSVDLPIPAGQSKAIIDEIIRVDDDNFVDIPFQVNVETMRNARVLGSFMAAGGAGDDIKVFILDEIDYINWFNGHHVEGLYNSGKITIAKIDVPITTSGKYHLVFDNRFSPFSNKNVLAKVHLYWSD